MPDNREQSQLRIHLNQIKEAVKGIGHDFSLEIERLDRRIGRLSDETGAEAERSAADIRREMNHLRMDVEDELRGLPSTLSDAGFAIGSKTRGAAVAARGAISSVTHSAKQGTKSLLARAGGVKKRAIREWSPPPEENDPGRGKN